MGIDRQKDPAQWSFQGILMTFIEYFLFESTSNIQHSYRFYRLPQSYSCFFAIILSMILVLIRPITISRGKAEKVAFVQTTIVVTLLHLGREIEFSDGTVSARTKPALKIKGKGRLFPFIFESRFTSNLLNSHNTLELAHTSSLSPFVRE